MRKLIQTYTTTREVDLLEAGDVIILHCDYWDGPQYIYLDAVKGTYNAGSSGWVDMREPRTVQAVLPPQSAGSSQTVWFVGVDGSFELSDWYLSIMEVTDRASK